MLLASAAALPVLLGAAGCRSQDVFTGPDPLAGRPPLGHDVLTLQAVIAAEEGMIDLYRAAISGDSGKQRASRARTLRALLAQHEQHLVRLKARLIPAGGEGSPPGAEGSGGSSPPANAVGMAQLRAAERASAADLVRRLATAPPALAQLLASIAASDATHVTALGG